MPLQLGVTDEKLRVVRIQYVFAIGHPVFRVSDTVFQLLKCYVSSG